MIQLGLDSTGGYYNEVFYPKTIRGLIGFQKAMSRYYSEIPLEASVFSFLKGIHVCSRNMLSAEYIVTRKIYSTRASFVRFSKLLPFKGSLDLTEGLKYK